MACSTCDGYEFVDAGDGGVKERCPDCVAPAPMRCPVHGRSLRDGRCPSCGREASVAIDLLDRARLLVPVPVPGVLL